MNAGERVSPSAEIYSPAWWLPGGNLQTLWGKLARKRRALSLRQTVCVTSDGDEVELWTHDGPAGSPHLLILHGLEGSLRSHYANGIASAAEDAGWNAHILLFRSCGSRANLTRRFYHSGDTADVRRVIEKLTADFPDAALFVAGISLGGNVLLKYLGERPEDVPGNLRAAAAVSVPFDLAQSAERINRGFSRIYQRFFLGSLKAKLLEKKKAFPDLPDVSTIEQLRTMVGFDDLVTAPLHGFEDAADYYRKSSAIDYLGGIRTPTLLLSAYDDPFLPPEVLSRVRSRAIENPALHIEFHRKGGHVGFVEGRLPWSARYYAERRIVEFFASFVADPPDQPR